MTANGCGALWVIKCSKINHGVLHSSINIPKRVYRTLSVGELYDVWISSLGLLTSYALCPLSLQCATLMSLLFPGTCELVQDLYLFVVCFLRQSYSVAQAALEVAILLTLPSLPVPVGLQAYLPCPGQAR